jgi:uncharacterized membrane protein
MERTAGGGRGFAALLVITGTAGLWAAWAITLDKFKLLQDPDFTPGCSLNPVVSCASVMRSDQASAFGFPNPMLSLAATPPLLHVGIVGMLILARWWDFWTS